MIRIDAVVLAALTPNELADVLRRVDPAENAKSVQSTASAVGPKDGKLSSFVMYGSDEGTYLGAEDLRLDADTFYTSARRQHLNTGKSLILDLECRLTINDCELSDTVHASLPGRPASVVHGHPALAHPNLVIRSTGTRDVVVFGETGKIVRELVLVLPTVTVTID